MAKGCCGAAASIAEIYLLDADGKRIPRESWKAIYTDSELLDGNHTADKAFDLQESTYWSSGNGAQFPHLMVIDLGDEYTVSGLEYLPRMETNAPGAIKNYRLYVKRTPFGK